MDGYNFFWYGGRALRIKEPQRGVYTLAAESDALSDVLSEWQWLYCSRHIVMACRKLHSNATRENLTHQASHSRMTRRRASRHLPPLQNKLPKASLRLAPHRPVNDTARTHLRPAVRIFSIRASQPFTYIPWIYYYKYIYVLAALSNMIEIREKIGDSNSSAHPVRFDRIAAVVCSVTTNSLLLPILTLRTYISLSKKHQPLIHIGIHPLRIELSVMLPVLLRQRPEESRRIHSISLLFSIGFFFSFFCPCCLVPVNK